MEATHRLTINLPTTIYDAAHEIASEQGVSLEQLACDAIAARAQKPPDLDLAEAYEILAEDSEATDVEIFMEAQTEALLNG